MFRTHLPLQATSHSVQVESKHKTNAIGNPYASNTQPPSSFDQSFAEFQTNAANEPEGDDASKTTEPRFDFNIYISLFESRLIC
jgi:hypothetical protein